MTKATRTTIPINHIEIVGFMLPDGSYVMSQTQAAELVGLTERNAREFLQSKALKALLGEGYTPANSEEIEADPDQATGSSRINPLPLEVVSVYWLWQASRGNKAAIPLCAALMTETLERRFDAAFQVDRTEAERNDRLTQQLQTLERDLAVLGDAYAWPDVQRDHIAALEAQIKALGAEPWQPPTQDQDG
jgi:hypothetical protein